MSWQPIATAPKDGQEVILWLPATPNAPARARCGFWQSWVDELGSEYHASTGEYLGQFPTGDGFGDYWWTHEGDYGHAEGHPAFAEFSQYAPTHWMPLPDAPQEDTPDAAR